MRAPVVVEGLMATRGELYCVELVEHPAGSRAVACACGAAVAWSEDGEPVKCPDCGLHHFKKSGGKSDAVENG